MNPALGARTTPRGHTPPTRRTTDRVIPALATLLLLLASTLITFDPEGVGHTASIITNLIFFLGAAAGPILLRATPLRSWIQTSIACALLACTVLAESEETIFGQFTPADLFFLASYAVLGTWFARGAYKLGSHDGLARLDAAASVIGSTLTLWICVLAPLNETPLASGLVWAIYPPLDFVFLVLALHLATDANVLRTSLRWFMVCAAAWTFLDSATAYLAIVYDITTPGPLIDIGYLIAHYALFRSATHPSIGHTRTRTHSNWTRTHPLRDRGIALITLTISPTILSTLIPSVGTVDTLTRTILISILLTLIFIRLERSMRAITRAEEHSRHQATHDSLTGLANRAALLSELDNRLAHRADPTIPTNEIAVLFIDCDDFKQVNDTWGHAVGDQLLRHIATHIPPHLHPEDLLCRQGGDEFVIITTYTDHAHIDHLARTVSTACANPTTILPGHQHSISLSIGIAHTTPGQPATTDTLLGHADLAMYEAKQRGRGRHIHFDTALAHRATERATIAHHLGHAINHNTITLELHPIHAGPNHQHTHGWQALPHWHHSTLGVVPPERFLPIAEEFGLSETLSTNMLTQAATAIADLRATHPHTPDLYIRINIAADHLRNPDFPRHARHACATAKIPHHALHLEINETALTQPQPETLTTLDQLRNDGFPLGIDGFGTGHAPLITFIRRPFHFVKLAQELTNNLDHDPDAPRTIRAIVSLLRSLGITHIAAQSIERTQQATILLNEGIDSVYGPHYGQPTHTTVPTPPA
ncbi:putative bifunctional diguanylate cyclase/phosphodiesterase [Dermatophilus congolensis]|uniref:putative bifunctional diguanylate cyclase/phosphodiesterase n=1 Tax=Dermatophilus congolensis TaxID=1863 RepID=UPI001AAFDEDD|nr:EAL domain-containing protein [Dermatophilus congolensis]MBO3141531.1 EAL domain-containing protein [Dermatophilus congolensis]MBO3144427.1 EAL domain-containing protein [Dermatophilus congolensis]MBO3148236.1 EAL domain-containing protein [Dermatophilus congolensis]MBO3150510.1 EAL domain-containing protein [Dermatophilus congolensis]MBO3153419.1 EAL domain-containing protein [Dermatophilus congolensis]